MTRKDQIKLIKERYGDCYYCERFNRENLKYGLDCYECKRFFSDLFTKIEDNK